MSDECPVKEGDVFNETDDDVIQRVLSVHPDRNPPVAMCRTIKRESSSEETDEEYALEYVDKCVEKRKQFVKFGYDKLNVYEVYKMSSKELKKVLRLGKQNSTGTKEEFRKRLLFFLNLLDVPSDVSSGSDTDAGAAAAAAAAEADSSDDEGLPNLDESDSSADEHESSDDDDDDEDEDFTPNVANSVQKNPQQNARAKRKTSK